MRSYREFTHPDDAGYGEYRTNAEYIYVSTPMSSVAEPSTSGRRARKAPMVEDEEYEAVGSPRSHPSTPIDSILEESPKSDVDCLRLKPIVESDDDEPPVEILRNSMEEEAVEDFVDYDGEEFHFVVPNPPLADAKVLATVINSDFVNEEINNRHCKISVSFLVFPLVII